MRVEEMRVIADGNFRNNLVEKPYPGRVIIIGRGLDGREMVSYSVMGRSEGSQNREFGLNQAIITTVPHDDSESVGHRELTLYNAIGPVGTIDGYGLVVSNGSHTDSIARHIISGATLAEAMAEETYEPDSAKTPRIAGVIHPDKSPHPRYELAIVTEDPEKPGEPKLRTYAYTYRQLRNGLGMCITTYSGEGTDPLQPFMEVPYSVRLGRAPIEVASLMAGSLNEDNFVATAAVALYRPGGLYSFAIEDRFATSINGTRYLDI